MKSFSFSSHRTMSLVLFGLMILVASGCSTMVAQSMNADGVRSFRTANYDDALKHFQNATYTDPTNPDGYYNLASTYHKIGDQQGSQEDLARAEHYYRTCLTYNPNHGACYRGLAVLMASQNRTDEAIRLLEDWAYRSPRQAAPKEELARMHYELGNRSLALEQLTEALAVNPKSSRAYAALGKIREDEGDKAAALANYQRSMQHSPDNIQVASRIAALGGNRMTPGVSAPNTAPGVRVVNQDMGTVPLR